MAQEIGITGDAVRGRATHARRKLVFAILSILKSENPEWREDTIDDYLSDLLCPLGYCDRQKKTMPFEQTDNNYMERYEKKQSTI